MDANRALLDELMGADRNMLSEEKKRNRRNFFDENVCKYFLCGFCPHDLFTNTKSDLGPCPKSHDEVLKREWENCPTKSRYPYESDFIRFLERQVNELDRRIEQHHKRLEVQDAAEGTMPEQHQLRCAAIDAECEVLLRKIESLGEEGLVDEATACHEKLKTLKTEKETIQRASAKDFALKNAQMNQISSFVNQVPEKKMRVCEICGAYLVISDNEKRSASHLDGKQHVGFALIRETLDAYFKKNEKQQKSREHEREREGRRSDEREGRRTDDRDIRRSDGHHRDRGDGHRRDDHRDYSRYNDDRRSNGGRRDRDDRDRRERRDEREPRREREDRDPRYKRERSKSRSRERDEKRSRK